MAKLTLAHKLTFAVLALFVAAFMAGFIYIYLGDQGANSNMRLSAKAAGTQYAPLKPPPAPSPKASVGVAIEALDTPVARGSASSLIVNTKADAYCNVMLKFNNTIDKDPALGTKQADAYGVVSWTFTIPPSAPLGTWPISVTCHDMSHAGVVAGELVVNS